MIYNYFVRAPIVQLLIILIVFSILRSCIVPFTPETKNVKSALVVQGLVTDQHEEYIVKLTKTINLWQEQNPKPLGGYQVWISDDLGNRYDLKERGPGNYVSDSSSFQGQVGRIYTLHLRKYTASGFINYESFPVEMRSVPPIDSLYYERKDYTIRNLPVEGCQIYLDAKDPTKNCNFYRWEYAETWEFHLPYEYPPYKPDNPVCWRTELSDDVYIKDASLILESRVVKFLINEISDPADRLSYKYSMLVRQYSMSEEEFDYWQALRTTVDQEGGLYDIGTDNIPNNLYCVENPGLEILGYFSVSAVTSKRIIIDEEFNGSELEYDCDLDTIYPIVASRDFPYLPPPPTDTTWLVWDMDDNWVIQKYYILFEGENDTTEFRVVSFYRECSDCTTRGYTIKPDYW